jgi:hypothetical protein
MLAAWCPERWETATVNRARTLRYPHELTPAGTVGEQGVMVARNPLIWPLDGCMHVIEYG